MLRDFNIGMYWEKIVIFVVVRLNFFIKFSFFNEFVLEIILYKEVDGILLSLLKFNFFYRLGLCFILYYRLYIGIICKLSLIIEKKLKIFKIIFFGRWLNEINFFYVFLL